VKPAGHIVFPPTRLVVVENTHNRAGGVIFPDADAAAICTLARDQGLATYCDGARLLNAAVAGARSPATLAAPFDLVGISLSKGLGCPVGSLLAGSASLIAKAVRYRRMLGGAMRQSGILAAAGSYALAHNVDRLADDHTNARIIGERLARGDDVVIDLERLRTNIVVFTLVERRGVPDAAAFVERCRARGVLVAAFGPRTVRAVTHLDVDRERCESAARIMAEVADGR
jgi:threonine aldolase